MRKVLIVPGVILILIIAVMLAIKHNYDKSPDYNFITAKFDIKNGSAKIINTGFRKVSSKDKEIDDVAAKYGFKNVFVGYDTTGQIMSGINDYNGVIDAYLNVRNGSNWKEEYQKKVDSLYKAASP